MNLVPEIVQESFNEEVYALPNRVLVLIACEWHELSSDECQLLSKILNSVNLSIDSVQLVSRKEFDLNFIPAIIPSAILSFGSRIPSITTHYEVAESSGIPVIIADSLANLDDEKKKLLWSALRKVFKRP